jgi:ankyrin repeat protein
MTMPDLLKAASTGKLEEVRKLLKSGWLKKGTDPNVADGDGATALHKAASKGHVEVLKALLDAGANINAAEEMGWTALHRAVMEDKNTAAQLLLNAGADSNVAGNLGLTPLHWAAIKGLHSIVTILLAKGAHINARTTENLYRSYYTNSDFLRDNDISADKQEKMLRTEHTGETPLHLAARGGHVRAVEALLAGGADTGIKTDQGASPLDWAREWKRTEIVPLLERHATRIAEQWKAKIENWKKSVDVKSMTKDLQDAGFAVTCCWVGAQDDAPPEATGAAAVHTVMGQDKAIISVAWSKAFGMSPPAEAQAIIRRYR